MPGGIQLGAHQRFRPQIGAEEGHDFAGSEVGVVRGEAGGIDHAGQHGSGRGQIKCRDKGVAVG